ARGGLPLLPRPGGAAAHGLVGASGLRRRQRDDALPPPAPLSRSPPHRDALCAELSRGRPARRPRSEDANVSELLLDIRDLHVHYPTDDGVAKAVDGVSLQLGRGETLAVVGESGSGKSQTMYGILGLVPRPPGRVFGEHALFEGEDLLRAKERRLRALRGDRIAMIFQDPMTALNPFLTVERQLTEVLEVHKGMRRKDARTVAIEMLARVGIPDPERRIDQYPHQFSGGMRPRVMIALALLCRPALLIADEPTTALDVTIQAQILELVRAIKAELGGSVILITHDLGVVAGNADRIAVMYAG